MSDSMLSPGAAAYAASREREDAHTIRAALDAYASGDVAALDDAYEAVIGYRPMQECGEPAEDVAATLRDYVTEILSN